MSFENADTEILCSSRTSAIVSPGEEAQFGGKASVSVMALSKSHNLDGSDFAPVFLSLLINRVLHVVRSKFKAKTVREPDRIMPGRILQLRTPRDKVEGRGRRFEVRQAVLEAFRHFLAEAP